MQNVHGYYEPNKYAASSLTRKRWRVFFLRYSRITSTKCPSFCVATISASVTNLTALLPQSCDCTNTLTSAHSPDLWSQARLADVTCAWSWRPRGISPRIPHILNNYIKHNPTEKLVVVQRHKNFPFHCIEPPFSAIALTIFRHCPPNPTSAGQTQSTIFLFV
jgi:hypothetical protein